MIRWLNIDTFTARLECSDHGPTKVIVYRDRRTHELTIVCIKSDCKAFATSLELPIAEG